MENSEHIDQSCLKSLAESYGVATQFEDYQGRTQQVSLGTVQAVLTAMGVDCSSDAAAWEALAAREAEAWTRTVAPTVVHTRFGGGTVDVTTRLGDSPSVVVHTELGAQVSLTKVVRHDDREVGGNARRRHCFEFAEEIPDGYHKVVVTTSQGVTEAALIAAPGRVPEHPALGKQRSGCAVQLYSVLSRHSWGMGDYADLADVAGWAAQSAGSDFVLINPVHANQPTFPVEASPYLPTSRRYFSPLYIRVEDIREWAYMEPSVTTPMRWTRDDLNHAVGSCGRIDRDAVWRVKRDALWEVFTSGRSAARQAAFDLFCAEGGDALTDFATWCALGEFAQRTGQEWSEQWESPSAPAVVQWRAQNSQAVDFHRWLQWVCSEQLAKAHQSALAAGMAIGVVNDLAVGVHPAGADSWALQGVLAAGASVGAPPDGFNQLGQDWSQPPWQPAGLAEAGYVPFRDVVRAALKHAGALRLDHVMGLFRLWWIPRGRPASEGTYVYYNDEVMLGIVCLEASRAGAIVVGEDLGTVEPVVREKLAQRGFLGTNVLWFEQEDGTIIPPHRWRRECLATVTTHDLPPTASYLSGEHVKVRHLLGVLSRSEQEEMAAAQHEVQVVIDGIKQRGLIKADDADDELAMAVALHTYLRITPAALMAWMLSDAVGERRMQNVPGTCTEYPNWTIPLADGSGHIVRLDDLTRHPHVQEFVAGLQHSAQDYLTAGASS